MPKKKLDRYRQKRTAGKTSEPFGRAVAGKTQRFIVHHHLATRAHYDLRLELGGVLLSWAVPKGPCFDPKEKRLAVHVEDHPVEYGDFEGVIPEGNYGAGTVILWDRGAWYPQEDPREGLARGKIVFELRGYKLRGLWALIKLRKSEKDWLLVKERDPYAESDVVLDERSVLSGKTHRDLEKPPRAPKELTRRVARLRAPKRALSPRTTSPMLATAHTGSFPKKGWLFEIKYDGYRLLVFRANGEVRLQSRNGFDYTAIFPEIAASALAIPHEDFVLDGELVVLDGESRPSFALLQRRAKLESPRDIEWGRVHAPATLFAFDLLAYGGFDLRDLPLERRKEILTDLVPDLGPLRLSRHFQIEGEKLFREISKMRLEGIVAKREDSPYVCRRSADWLKIRADKTDDFVIVGYTAPAGGRTGFGALLVAQYEGKRLVYAGRVGTGFSDTDLDRLGALLRETTVKKPPLAVPAEAGAKARWVKPTLVAEIRYKERNEALRHPVFLRLRDDKTPAECRRDAEPSLVPRAPAAPKSESGRARAPGTVEITNPKKVFFPKHGITKEDLVAYHRGIAKWMLPYLADRPLMLTRYPDGVRGKSFYQKDAPAYVPEWLRIESIWSEHSQREIRYFICESEAALSYIINMGTIPIHLWASRVSSLSHPDWCVLDLDPKTASFEDVVTIALAIRDLCEEIGMPCFPKTSGKSGLHVLLPLNGKFTHDQSKTLGQLIATVIVSRLPDIATTERLPKKREGKVYVDYLQNGWGKTIAAPYCVRPEEDATVSTPLTWKEVNRKLKPVSFTVRTIPKRMARLKRDPMAALLSTKAPLERALRALAKLV